MTTITTNATTRIESTKGQFLSHLKETLACWTVTRADMARMQRESAREYKANH